MEWYWWLAAIYLILNGLLHVAIWLNERQEPKGYRLHFDDHLFLLFFGLPILAIFLMVEYWPEKKSDLPENLE